MTVGIDAIRVWPSTLALPLEALCTARGRDPSEAIAHLGVVERTVLPPWEDSVTMAVNAASDLLHGRDRSRIGLLVVGTETPVDLEKPISSWAHRLLGLPSTCRNFEVKHACYSGTAALHMALAWLGSPAGRGKQALVVTSDASFLGLHEPHEYVLGAGAVALLLSHDPGFLVVDPDRTGVHASEVTDVIRPTLTVETGSSEASLFAYLEAVDGAWDAFLDAGPPVDFARDFAHFVFHAPFPGITSRAHRTLLGRDPDLSVEALRADFARRSEPGLVHHRRMGGVYGGSVFVSLLGAVDARETLVPGDRIGVFSFGSGSCSEVWTARLGPRAREEARAARLGALLDARTSITPVQYEALEARRSRDRESAEVEGVREGWGEHHAELWEGRGRCELRGVRGWVREYAWS
ncbi:MAG: hydroxymethylglutaryl-CoA synthase [Myxococcota bacterium]